MSVGKIALGVFLGNLAFAVLVWVAVGMAIDRQAAKASLSEARAQYQALQASGQSASSPSTPH